GQHLANAGSTGWSTGPHLHFQVNTVHANDTRLCECGEKGADCAEDQAAWASFWSTGKYPSLPVSFDEWPAGECADRRIPLPLSSTVDDPVDTRLVTIDRFGPKALAKPAPKPLIVLGIGGRRWSRSPVNDKSRPPFVEIPQPSRAAPSPARPRR